MEKHRGELKQLGEQIRENRLPGALARAGDRSAGQPGTAAGNLTVALPVFHDTDPASAALLPVLREKPFCTEYPWRRMAIRLLTRSMPLLGSVLFFYIFFQARRLFDTVPGIQEMFSLLIVWLFTKWGLNFITLQSQQDPQLLPTAWVPA
jgi:hypothetical protein